MKNILPILFVVSYTFIFSQEFAPIGAEWYYGRESPMSFVERVSYIKVNSTKDSVILSKNCREINIKGNQFVYLENDTVYFYDKIFNEFQILYAFNAQVNDFWLIKVQDETNDIDTIKVMVDSLSVRTINNIDLKTLNVTYSKIAEHSEPPHQGVIIESIGDMHYMFNWKSETSDVIDDTGYFTGLRCYEDNVLGFYKFSALDCDYQENYNYIECGFPSPLLEFYPNPPRDYISFYSKENSIFNLEIIDINGKIIKKLVVNSNQRIDISNLSNGIYFICLKLDNEIVKNQKLLIKNH